MKKTLVFCCLQLEKDTLVLFQTLQMNEEITDLSDVFWTSQFFYGR